MKVSELARLVEGIVEGDGNIEITGLSGIETSKAGLLTFATDNEKLAQAEDSAVSCVLTSKTVRKSAKTLIRVANPKLSFLIIYNILNTPKPRGSFVHPTAVVADASRLGKNVWVGPHVSIEENVDISDNCIIESNTTIKKNCRIGASCRIYPNVTLYEDTVLGRNVVLHSGAVIGSDGFGYIKEKGKIFKFPQIGRVIIEDDVEVGANTTIDRGSMNDTIIGPGSKIDNLCQIAHNVKIGKNALIAAQCGISGSTTVGNDVMMGGQSGIIDNLKIGSNVVIAAKSAVIGDLKDGVTVWGLPARPIGDTKKQMAALSWLSKNFSGISKIFKRG